MNNSHSQTTNGQVLQIGFSTLDKMPLDVLLLIAIYWMLRF